MDLRDFTPGDRVELVQIPDAKGEYERYGIRLGDHGTVTRLSERSVWVQWDTSPDSRMAMRLDLGDGLRRLA